jgi:hypothetical protein
MSGIMTSEKERKALFKLSTPNPSSADAPLKQKINIGRLKKMIPKKVFEIFFILLFNSLILIPPSDEGGADKQHSHHEESDDLAHHVHLGKFEEEQPEKDDGEQDSSDQSIEAMSAFLSHGIEQHSHKGVDHKSYDGSGRLVIQYQMRHHPDRHDRIESAQ